MNKTSIAILSFSILFIVSCSRNDASYTVEDRIISTYPFSFALSKFNEEVNTHNRFSGISLPSISLAVLSISSIEA